MDKRAPPLKLTVSDLIFGRYKVTFKFFLANKPYHFSVSVFDERGYKVAEVDKLDPHHLISAFRQVDGISLNSGSFSPAVTINSVVGSIVLSRRRLGEELGECLQLQLRNVNFHHLLAIADGKLGTELRDFSNTVLKPQLKKKSAEAEITAPEGESNDKNITSTT